MKGFKILLASTAVLSSLLFSTPSQAQQQTNTISTCYDRGVERVINRGKCIIRSKLDEGYIYVTVKTSWGRTSYFRLNNPYTCNEWYATNDVNGCQVLESDNGKYWNTNSGTIIYFGVSKDNNGNEKLSYSYGRAYSLQYNGSFKKPLTRLAHNTSAKNAELQKLRRELKQGVESRKKSSVAAVYIEDRRTQTEKQARNNFVAAWSKLEPNLAPFMGVWGGYEDVRYIYPSKTKGRVCIIKNVLGDFSFTTGKSLGKAIQTDNGEVLFKEGNYLGTAIPKNGRLTRNYDVPFHSPTPLSALPKLLNLVDSYRDFSGSSYRYLIQKRFKDAGCTTRRPR